MRDEIFAEVTFHGAYEPQRAVRTRRSIHPPLCGPAQSGHQLRRGAEQRLLVARRLGRAPLGARELYDLVHYPHEAHNLAGNPAVGAALADLRARLDAWMRATDEPLLHGPVAPPPGAQVTDPRTGQDVQVSRQSSVVSRQ